MGRSAVLRHGDVHIVVTSRSGPHFAPELFRAAGLDPFAAERAGRQEPVRLPGRLRSTGGEDHGRAAPGCAPSDFWNYEYRNIPRPLWPWDEIAWSV